MLNLDDCNNHKLDPKLIVELAKKYHTPYYLFSENTLRMRCQEVKRALAYPKTVIRYACKALTLQAILKIIKSEGLWIDASSLNEAKRAVLAGYNAKQVSYTGESNSVPVFNQLFDLGVTINCSSLDQIRMLGKLKPGAKFSFRLNPGEGHGANNKINTGGPASKHGIYIDQLNQIKELIKEYGLLLNGVHTHIGSGTDLQHWLRIKDITLEVAKSFDDLDFINLGGGLPVVYNPETDHPMPLNEWGERLSESMTRFSEDYGKTVELHIEPGRYITADSGYLVAEVQNIKNTPAYTFAIVNSGLNHNIRPAMYAAYHPIEFVRPAGEFTSEQQPYVIAGYLCESGDVFTSNSEHEPAPRNFPKLELGDLMVMSHIGAYSHSMKSDYNSMNFPASLLLQSDSTVRVIERRGTLDDIMRREVDIF